MSIPFWKMHGIQNSYVCIDGFSTPISDPNKFAREVLNPHRGVFAEGLLLILPSEQAQMRMRMFNTDGSEAEMCGNGIRCAARLASDLHRVGAHEFQIETLSGVLSVWMQPSGVVRVKMNKPSFDPASLPLVNSGLVEWAPPKYRIATPEGEVVQFVGVSVGNPHAVVFDLPVEVHTVQRYGSFLETAPCFPNRTNVEFIEVISRSRCRMRVWERGNGETQACGTGACASVAAGVELGLLERTCTVELLGGELEIEYTAEGELFLTGPTAYVCQGQFSDELVGALSQ